MVRLLFAAALAALAGCYSSEGSGRVAIASFEVRDFDSVALGGVGEVTVAPGDFSVSVSAEDDVLPSVRVERDGDTLVLGRDVDWIDGVRPTVPIEIRVTMPTLAEVGASGSGAAALAGWEMKSLRLEVSGAGRIDAVGLHVDHLDVEVSGAGAVRASDVHARTLRCELRGASRVTMDGGAEHVSIHIGGAGLYRGSRLRSSRAYVEATGVGQAFVWARDRLDARVNGGARVIYGGAPTVTSAVQRDGVVTALDAAPAAP